MTTPSRSQGAARATPSPPPTAAILDDLPAQVAILDGDARIVLVNAAWRSAAIENGPSLPHAGVGADYLAVCDAASERGDQVAKQAADGLRALLRGEQREFVLEYPCHSPTEERWFGLHAACCTLGDARGIVMLHLDQTRRRVTESDARQAAVAQGFIVRTQQEMADPDLGFENLMQLVCERAQMLTRADGALIEMLEGADRSVTRFATREHSAMIGSEVLLEGSFTGEVVRTGVAMLCRDCSADPRVDQAAAHRAGAAAMIASPIRIGGDAIGVLKVVSSRLGAFQSSDVANLQVLAESLRFVLQRLEAERELARIHRAQQLLSLSNLAQARLEDESALLEEICRLAIEVGGYREAWVGYTDGDGVRRVANAGAGSSGPSAPERCEGLDGFDPSVEAARRGTAFVYQTLLDVTESWALTARRAGHRSAIFLPLQAGQSALGVLCLFGAQPGSFTPDEQRMLHDMAGDLSFGIRHIRSQRDRRRLEQTVITVAAGVSATNASEFFERLCTSMSQALEAPATFVTRVVRHSGAPRLRTLAAVVDQRVIPNLEVDCLGTPFERLLEEDEMVVPDRLGATGLARAAGLPDARCCVGRRLVDSRGVAVGMLIVMWRQPLQATDFVTSTLRIFAARAASELERRQAEVRLREQASLLDQARDAIVVRGLDGRVRYWNKGAERMYGWTAEEAMGDDIPPPPEEDQRLIGLATQQVMETGEWSGSMNKRHKDGRIIPTESHWTLVTDSRPQSILSIDTDVSRRLAVEAQLQQSQRLESLGQLTGGVAHDFNNLLTVILVNSELLTELLDHDPNLHELAEMIRGAAERGAGLTNRLLAFARRQNLNTQPLDVRALVDGMAGLLRRTLSETIEVIRDTPADIWSCLADAPQLEAAILNLCLNARDAMPRGGRIVIESRNWSVRPQLQKASDDLAPGDYVRLRVTDTGTGIAPADLPRVFEPFFTTKSFGKGTGLGLSMVYGFVKQSHGHLAIESEVGRGTSVTLFLPRAQRAEEIERPLALALQGGTETILLAEDDPLVRAFAERQLRKLGYDVIAVEDGHAALDVLSSTAQVDLLFTDVVMPGGLAGPELVEAARNVRPGLRALYSSGYTDSAMDDLTPARAAPLLQKPYQRRDLAQKIRAALEGGLPSR